MQQKPNQRLAPRTQSMPSPGIIKIYVKTSSGEKAIGSACMYDVSRSGAGLTMDMCLPVGMRITMVNRYFNAEGIVRNVRLQESGYVVGVQLLPGSRGFSTED